MKTPVCSEDQSPAREVITQLLEDALKAEPSEQPEQAFFKPHLVRYFGFIKLNVCVSWPVGSVITLEKRQ